MTDEPKQVNYSSADAEIELPRYVCHKKVHALKIAKIENFIERKGLNTDAGRPGARITPENGRYSPFNVDAAYCQKHQPKAGGYYVVYEDGYKSWSPAEAFENGYTLID